MASEYRSHPRWAFPISQVVADMPQTVPFVGPEEIQRARRRPFRARLGANESSFGPSPLAIAAMRDAASESWMYADPQSFDLRSALSKHHAIPIDQVMIGEGIDGLLGLAAKVAVSPSTTVVTSNGAYPTFNFHVAANGGRLVLVPFRDDREDLDALLEAAKREDASLIYVSNPNNPMGSVWRADVIAEFIARVPENILVLLDEAYADTAPAGVITPIDTLQPTNLIRFRTFSKAYGLAGARIGYAIAVPEVISLLDSIRNDYGINRVGLQGALAALDDQTYLLEVVEKISRARVRVGAIAADNGLVALPSATNFVAIDCGRDGAFAVRVMQEVLARDVFVRKPGAPGLDRCIRVSVGDDAALDIFAEVLAEALLAAA